MSISRLFFATNFIVAKVKQISFQAGIKKAG